MRLRRIIAVSALLATALAASPAASQADEPSAAVSMGDSYIAGEGGRWLGNASTSSGSRAGTDRAATRRGWFYRYNREAIYGDSYANGCHRSDVAPIRSAGLAVDAVFNLACSGASTVNLLPGGAGGLSYRGEAPQVDQLRAVAQTHAVEVVVISIGGNDLGFTDVILDCVTGYVTSSRWFPNTCQSTQDRNIRAALPAAMTGVRNVLAETRSVLDQNGDSDARIILQSYPSPVAESTNIRYRETGWDRTFRGGCPVWDTDLNWANQTLIPLLTTSLAAEAEAAGAEFLDLSQALKGHEACAGSARQGPGPDGAGAEWIRFISTGITQGDAEESAHPNAYGQQAMGRCLALAIATDSQPDSCVNTPGSGVAGMQLR